jgi:hypothetical protein
MAGRRKLTSARKEKTMMSKIGFFLCILALFTVLGC